MEKQTLNYSLEGLDMNSNQAGITAQYGFHYQKLAFIYCILSHTASDCTYIYEGCDDVEISKTEDSLFSVSFDQSVSDASSVFTNAIQVKSGKVDKECWARVIGNWLLISEDKNLKPCLFVENSLDFDIYDESTIDYVVKYLIDHKGGRRNSIAARVCKKFGINKNTDPAKLKITIITITHMASIHQLSQDAMDHSSEMNYLNAYCGDIKVFDRAKAERYKRFKSEINTLIEESIGKKLPCVLTYNNIMTIIMDIKERVGDYVFKPDFSALRTQKEEQAKKLLNDSSLREVQELKKVDDRPVFVVEELINELFYKDLRDTYKEKGVSDAEYEAFANHRETVIDLINPTPIEDYKETTRKRLTSRLFSDSSIYSKGCYIYMTSNNVPDNRKITWGSI